MTVKELTPLGRKPTDLTNYYTKPETDALLDEKLDITSLSSNITLYATTTASDIPGYNKLVTDIDDPDYDEPAVNVPIGPITGVGQVVGELGASAGLFVGNPGIINITTIGEIRRISPGSGRAEFYFKVFHRDSLGTETEIAISNTTGSVESTVYAQFYTVALLNNGAFSSTDRITVKFYADKIGGGPDPEYEFMFGGSNPVRTLIPVPVSVLPVDGKQPYILVTSDQSIAVGSVYGAECTSDIILTLSDGTSEGQTLTVKKLDDTDYSVYVNTSSLIDGESSIEITMEGESYDFYWTGSTFIIK